MSGKLFTHTNLIGTLFATGSAAIVWFALSFFDAKTELAVVRTNVENVTKSNDSLKTSLNTLTQQLAQIGNSLSKLQESSDIVKKRLDLAENGLRYINTPMRNYQPTFVHAMYPPDDEQKMEFKKQDDGTWQWTTGDNGIRMKMVPNEDGTMSLLWVPDKQKPKNK